VPTNQTASPLPRRARALGFLRGNAVGVLALIVASSGTALAATQLPDDSVDSDTIVYQSVDSEDLAEDSVASGKIRTDAVRGRAVKESSLDPDVLQRRVGGECRVGESIRAIGNDGSVLCQVDTTGATGAAGGDLTGSYPNPQIADGSVVGSNIVDRTIAGIDVALNALTGAEVDESTLTAGGDLTGSLANAQVGESGLTAGGDLTGTLANAQVSEGGLTAGGDLTGTLANAQLGGETVGTTELAPLPDARAVATTTQTFAAGAITRVQLNANSFSQEVTFDDAGDQFVVERSGIYAITAEVLWKTNAAGLRFLSVYQDNASVSNELVTDSRAAVAGYATLQNVTTVQRLTAGQVVFALAATSAGGNTDVGEGDSTSRRGASMTISYLGPAVGLAHRAGEGASTGRARQPLL
jgi:hypothetical protein